MQRANTELPPYRRLDFKGLSLNEFAAGSIPDEYFFSAVVGFSHKDRRYTAIHTHAGEPFIKVTSGDVVIKDFNPLTQDLAAMVQGSRGIPSVGYDSVEVTVRMPEDSQLTQQDVLKLIRIYHGRYSYVKIKGVHYKDVPDEIFEKSNFPVEKRL